MKVFGARKSRRLLDVVTVASALVALASVVGLTRAVTGSAQENAVVPDPDLARRCGADVLLVADATLSPGLVADAGRQLASAVSDTGTRLALVVAADLARPIGDGFAEVTAASTQPGGAVDELLAALAAGGPADARNWPAGLEQAGETARADGGARPLLVLYLTDGPSPGLDVATRAAAELRERPGTHLAFVATGAAAALGAELAAVAGPDVVTVGGRALDVARDDVVIAADPAGVGPALRTLGTGLCAATLRVDAMDAGTGAVAPRDGVGLALATAAGTPAAAIEPAGGAQLTDAAGRATWQVVPTPGTTATLTLTNPDAPAGARSLTCLGADGVSTFGNGANLVVAGVPAGADIVCQLRLLDESRPLRFRMVPFPGDVTCPEDLAGLAALTAAPLGSPVTYCLELVNQGRRSAIGVQVEVPGLDQAGPAWIVESELPPSARARQRYVINLESPGPLRGTATAEGMAAEAGAFVGVLPPAMTIEKLAAGDPACGDAPETPRPCYRMVNTGGTWLDQLNLTPTWTTVPWSIERRMAPGEILVVGDDGPPQPLPAAATEVRETATGETLPASETQPASDAPAVATARAVDAAGNPLADLGPVTTAPVPGAPLALDTLVNDDLVAPGDVVDFGLTVSNPVGGTSLAAVSMTDTACPAPGSSTELAGNGDSSLDGGESWLFACSARVDTDVLSVAAVLAQDQTGTTVQQTDARKRSVETASPNLRIKKSQVNDLVPGSPSVYELKVQNTGRFAAPNVVVTDPLPAGLIFLGATSDIGASAQTGGVVACSLGTIAPQEGTEAFVVRITVDTQPALTDQVVRNDASVTSDAGDLDPSDNTSFVRSKVGTCVRNCPAVTAEGGDQPNNGGSGGSGGGGGTEVGSEQLARTGVDNVAASGWGLVLVAAGLSFVASARRRWALVAAPALSA